jgi:hypothetical protein
MNKSTLRRLFLAGAVLGCFAVFGPKLVAGDLARGLVGYWKLRGDCRDSSGLGNQGLNHGVDLAASRFDGKSSYLEVPHAPSLGLGAGDFSFSVWVWTEEVLDDVIGDVIDKYDPSRRRGITLSIDAGAGGYSSQSGDRHVHFGIDDARLGDWQDCGRPNPTSNYVSNSLTVYRGNLFAAATDAKEQQDWCHDYRYEGEARWVDCGRVGDRRTTGVGPMIVHDGSLYAVTWTYDWTRVSTGNYDAGRVYRYAGGTAWEDRGQPSDNRTLNCIGSYRGKLYVGGGPETWGVFVQEGESRWRASRTFPKQGPERCFPHAMSCYNGKLYVAYPAVYSFDGGSWTYAGIPAGPVDTLQTHSFEVYQGRLCAGTWPEGKVARYLGGETWQELGRVGADGTEVNALVVYNGKLYGGSIPRAEVCRYDGGPQWTSLRRFYSPDGWQPASPSQVGGAPTRRQINEWSRVTSLAVFAGRLFASIGSCTSSILDAPADVRGRVFSMEAGRSVSYDADLGAGWKHLAAIRDRGTLKLYIDGRLVSRSSTQEPADYDVSTDRPLRIGFGSTDYFSGKIAQLRAYQRALSDEEVGELFSMGKP